MRGRWVLTTAAMVVAATLVPVGQAAAAQRCTCGSPAGPGADARNLDRADVVFKGVLEGSTSSASMGPDGKVVTSGQIDHFRVITTYKGRDLKRRMVQVRPDPSCSPFDVEGTNLVFAAHPAGVREAGPSDLLIVRPCRGSRPIGEHEAPAFADEGPEDWDPGSPGKSTGPVGFVAFLLRTIVDPRD